MKKKEIGKISVDEILVINRFVILKKISPQNLFLMSFLRKF